MFCQQSNKQDEVISPQTTDDWRVGWRNATVAFGEIKHDNVTNRDYFSAVGTGVLISTGPTSAYLVTAKHMFCDPEKHWFPTSINIRFAWQDRKSIYSYLGIPFTLRNDKGTPLWFALEGSGDVAAMSIPEPSVLNRLLPPDDRQNGTIFILGMDSLGTEIYEGEQVLIFGYPGIAGKDRLARAIIRQGIVAWTNPNDPTNNVFLVDANLFPGNSGGPVARYPFGLMKDGKVDYISGAAKITLLGIVSEGTAESITGTISGPRVGQIEMRTQIAGIGAVGIIEPASKIARLLTMIQQGKATPSACDVQGTGTR
jgi:hypothetical protein